MTVPQLPDTINSPALNPVRGMDLTSKSDVTFGLDYDGTVTSDPELFRHFVTLLKTRGHKVYVVTMRYMSECRDDSAFMDFAKLTDGFFATGRQAKKPYCLNHGVCVHIWLDDNPEAIHMNADQIWKTPSPEGNVIIERHSNETS